MVFEIDFFEDTVKALKTLGINMPVQLDMLSEKRESIAFRYIPSAAASLTYKDGKAETRNAQFQLLAKSPDQREAITALSTFVDGIDTHFYSNEFYKVLRVEPYGMLQYVERTEKKEYIYSVFFTVEVQIK